MGTEERVSVSIAAKNIFGSRRLWPITIVLVMILSASWLLPRGIVQTAIGVLAAVLYVGYSISVARAVLEGGDALPSPVSGFTAIVRRGVSASLVEFVPELAGLTALGVITLAVGLLVSAEFAFAAHFHLAPSDWFRIPMGRLVLVFALPLAIAVVEAFIVIATARYVAFDRLHEGFRYSDAWRQFTTHKRSGLRVVGWTLLGAVVLRLSWTFALMAVGLDPLHAQRQVFAGIRDLATWPERAVLAILLTYLAVSVLWHLVAARLLGQYASVAFKPEPDAPSV